MLETVRRVLARPFRPTTVRECRHCGTSLSAAADVCPACDSTEIATYVL